jgi:subtilisin family serine protease
MKGSRMKRTFMAVVGVAPLALALTLAATPAQAGSLVPVTAASGDAVAGQYIVTLKSGAAASVASTHGIAMRHIYNSAVKGFAATLSGAQLHALQSDSSVAGIEPNQVVRIATTQSPTPSWGIDRIDQRNLPLSNSYTYTATGAGVTAYIIDTGINPTHPDFGGRAAVAFDATGGNGIDCHGHGTHVAGTIGSTSYGVAKGVALRGVRVLNCAGSGTTADVIAGVDWVTANSPGSSVANMSLGGGKSTALNNAVANLSNSGVLVAVAAGNSSANACNSSPSSEPTAMTVAASTITDASASFTNFGRCVDLYAPGVNITSTWLGSGTNTISGTSMATPHVAGVAALYKSTFGDAPSATVASYITSNATAGVLSGVPRRTPNLLLYTNQL